LIGGSRAYTVFAEAPSLTFNLMGGDDLLTLDASNGFPSPQGGISYDGGSENDQLVVSGTTQADNVTFNGSSVSFGASAMNHLNLEKLSYDGVGGLDSVNVSGGAVVTLQSDLQLQMLSINGTSARVVVPAGRAVLSVNSLHVEGLLDLTDNDLVVNNGSYTDVQQLILQGFGGGATGITSSSSDGSQILATFDNALVGAGDWNGVTIEANAVVGKYTYFGDVNFDGQVTGDDYTIIDSNLNTTPPVGFEWLSGDANLDGMVTGDDYTTIDSNLGLGSGGPAAPASVLSPAKQERPLRISSTTDLLE